MFDILEAMQQDGCLSYYELLALRKTSHDLGENQVRVLRSLNIASSEQIQGYLKKYFNIPTLEKNILDRIDESFQAYLPQDLAVFYSCFGFAEEQGTLYIAMEDPTDIGALAQIKFFLDKKVIGVAATIDQLAKGLGKIYNLPLTSLRLTTAIEKTDDLVASIRNHTGKD